MAKKKEPSISDVIGLFKDIIKRGKVESFTYNNRTLMGYNNKNIKFYLNLEAAAWNAIVNDNDIRPMLTEFNLKDSSEHDRMAFSFCQNINDEEFIELNGESFYNGENIDIKVDGFDYDITINKSIFPIRFKKSEGNNFSYRIYLGRYPVLLIKKDWDPIVPDSGISMIRLFQIV